MRSAKMRPPSLPSGSAAAIADPARSNSLKAVDDPSSSSSPSPPPSTAARLRMSPRVCGVGEHTVDSIDLRKLGTVHDRRPGRHLGLTWESRPRRVLVVANPHSRSSLIALPVVVENLQTYDGITVLVETEAMADAAQGLTTLRQVSAGGDIPSRDLSAADALTSPTIPVAANNLSNTTVAAPCARKRPTVVTRVTAPASPGIAPSGSAGIQDEIDLVVCLGGDGLILHVVSQLFPRAIPPVMPFNNGSLGFLTPFDVREHKSEIARVITGENNMVTVRMRLKCVIVPKGRRNRCLDSSRSRTPSRDRDTSVSDSTATDRFKEYRSAEAMVESDATSGFSLQSPPTTSELDGNFLEYHVLNEIVIDRGAAPYLSNLEVFADDCPVTRVQADGLIVATPTGSTAYSLSSGGSMVHPSVPAILFTPICPHSLSFRPVLFPHDVVLQIKVPEDARASAWVSCDGRHRMELQRGDKVVVCASQYPVPTFTRCDTTRDWFASVSQCLRWNERVQQTPLYGEDDRFCADVLTSMTDEERDSEFYEDRVAGPT